MTSNELGLLRGATFGTAIGSHLVTAGGGRRLIGHWRLGDELSDRFRHLQWLGAQRSPMHCQERVHLWKCKQPASARRERAGGGVHVHAHVPDSVYACAR